MKTTQLPPHTLQKDPVIHKSVFIAKGARVLGDVRIHQDASVWYNTVLRGDINYIEIGERSNIQDGCIVHLTNEKPCIVGKDVTVGHHVNLHGCTIEDGCLIGIGAIVLTGAHIKKGSVIGAGTVVLENTVVEEGSLVVGIPGKKVRVLGEESYQTNLQWAAKYVGLAQLHREKYGMADVNDRT